MTAEGKGKTYRGQPFVPVKSPGDVQEQLDADAVYAKEGTVSIETYFAVAGVRDPVMKASMLAFTLVRHATVEDWAKIFAKH
jgi:hypothetical protein